MKKIIYQIIFIYTKVKCYKKPIYSYNISLLGLCPHNHYPQPNNTNNCCRLHNP